MLNRVGWAAVAAALAVTALAPVPAYATVSVGMAGGDLVVSDSDGQAATVNVVTSPAPAAPLAGAGYVISVPTSHALDSKPPCQPLVAAPAPQVTCPYDQVTAVTVVLGDGNDALTVTTPAGAPEFADLTLSLGDGTDTATVSVGATTGVSLQGNGGDDNMRATSGRGQVQIEGDAGNDRAITSGRGRQSIDGGDGDDVIAVNPVAPADASMTGGAGNDTMDAGTAGGGSLLIAGDGDDKLIAGRRSGDDILEGGPGADVFSLENDHKPDSLVCGPGDDQIIGAVFGQDSARDGCPPVDAIHFASRARAVLAGAQSTASLRAHVHVAVTLTQVQLVKVGAAGAQTVLASARRIRLARSGTLRLRLSTAGRTALRHSGTGRLLIRGTLRRADGRGDPMPFAASRRFAITAR